jgi:hypothetical protein
MKTYTRMVGFGHYKWNMATVVARIEILPFQIILLLLSFSFNKKDLSISEPDLAIPNQLRGYFPLTCQSGRASCVFVYHLSLGRLRSPMTRFAQRLMTSTSSQLSFALTTLVISRRHGAYQSISSCLPFRRTLATFFTSPRSRNSRSPFCIVFIKQSIKPTYQFVGGI